MRFDPIWTNYFSCSLACPPSQYSTTLCITITNLFCRWYCRTFFLQRSNLLTQYTPPKSSNSPMKNDNWKITFLLKWYLLRKWLITMVIVFVPKDPGVVGPLPYGRFMMFHGNNTWVPSDHPRYVASVLGGSILRSKPQRWPQLPVPRALASGRGHETGLAAVTLGWSPRFRP